MFKFIFILDKWGSESRKTYHKVKDKYKCTIYFEKGEDYYEGFEPIDENIYLHSDLTEEEIINSELLKNDSNFIFILRNNEMINDNIIELMDNYKNTYLPFYDAVYLPTKNIDRSKSIKKLKEEGKEVNYLGWINFPDEKARILKSNSESGIEWMDGKPFYVKHTTSLLNEEFSVTKFL